MSSDHHHRQKYKLSYRIRRYLFRLLIILCLFVGLVFGSAFYLSPQDKLERADAIVVVSGGQTRTRAERGIELYKQGWAPKLIFSGAALDNGPSNAHEMRLQALRAGVPDDAILSDEDARTTYQNAENTKRFVDDLRARTVILVTSPYHQRRAMMTFERVYGADYTFVNQSSFDNRWSKAAWWATPFGVYITGSELVKVIYSSVTHRYQ